jgi:prevent-host-death family protein
MRIAPVAEVKARLSHYLDAAQDGPVVVTRNGRPVAVLAAVPEPEDLERFVLAHTPRFRRLLEAAERRIAETGGVPHEAFWAAVEAEAGRSTAPPVTPAAT